MQIAKLTISYDRGLARNDEQDLKADENAAVAHRGFTTKDGKIIRGLGTHYRSNADQAIVKRRDFEAARIRQEFREKFLVTPLDGVYVIPAPGAAQAFADTLNTSPELEITVRVTEFTLQSADGLDGAELGEWATRIKKQLDTVQLGRKKETDEDGLNALVTLSRCPVLSKETGRRIRELVEAVRNDKLTRIELKRSIADLNVKIEQGELLVPRRAVLA